MGQAPLPSPAGRSLLLRCVRAAGGSAVVLALVCVTGAAAQLALPAALGRTVDTLLGSGSPARWLLVTGLLIATAAAAEVLSPLVTGAGNARATAWLRRTLAGHLIALPVPVVRAHPVGDLVARLTGQATAAGTAASAVVLGVTSIVPPIGSLVALLLIDVRLGLACAAGLLVLSLLLRRFVTDASAAARDYQVVQGRLAAALAEALGGSRTIAAAGTAGREIDRILRPLPELSRHGRGTWDALATAAGRTSLLGPLTQIVVLATGGLLLGAGRITPGDLLAATQYAALGAGLGAILATLNRLIRVRTAAARADELLTVPATAHGCRTLRPGPGELRFLRVSVRAGDRPVLDGVDLVVPAGRTVAVVGSSGAGKSTLAAVAGRLLDPDEGCVLLDGTPLPALTSESLRRAIGYGFERPSLFGRTVREAVGLGRPEALVRATTRTAAIDDYLDRLPHGLDTPLRALPRSGGENQRLGLARALTAERLLILDDASSSLDTVTEARIMDVLLAPDSGRTRLIVTHRPAVAARADLVAWLSHGRLVRVDSHDRLWAVPDYRAVFGGPA